VFEKKTRNTRKRKRNRYISINNAVIEAVTLYLEHTPNVCLSDYLFTSEANPQRSRHVKEVKPLSVYSIERILKQIAKDLDLNIHVATHTLRKTFCYHQMVMSNNDHRKLLLLQKMMNHSSPQQTLDYIGITSEEIEAAYKALNLGYSKYNYLQNTMILEFDSANKAEEEVKEDVI
jgi:integrase